MSAPLRVGLLQCQFARDIPHMNMPLFAADLRNSGHAVDCICACGRDLSALLKRLRRRRYALLAVDAVFPLAFLKELVLAFPKTSFVTGGPGCWDAFIKTDIQFAVIGAGRLAMRGLADALAAGLPPAAVPNLFHKKARRIDHSGIDAGFDVSSEMFPYAPDLSWEYCGFPGRKKPLSAMSPVTLVADFGCGRRRPFTGRVLPRLSAHVHGRYRLSAAAAQRLARIQRERESGCSFCTYFAYSPVPVQTAVASLVKQADFLQKTYGLKRFAIGSEDPFCLLQPFLDAASKAQIKLEQLNLRCRADRLNRSAELFERFVRSAGRRGVRVVVWQIGFESFLRKDLDLFSKGYAPGQNRKALAGLNRLARRYPGQFKHESHGFIGVHPWTTVEDLAGQIASLRRCGALPFSFPLADFWLRLYDPLLVIHRRIRAAGLLARRQDDCDGFRIRDPRLRLFLRLAEKARVHIALKAKGARRYDRLLLWAHERLLALVRGARGRGHKLKSSQWEAFLTELEEKTGR